MRWIDKVRLQALAITAVIAVLMAVVALSLSWTGVTLHAQQVGPGGVPGVGSGGGAVSSVFGRTGAVVATTGDYTAAQVTNAAATNAANTFTENQTISGSAPRLTLYTSGGESAYWYLNAGQLTTGNATYGADELAFTPGPSMTGVSNLVYGWASGSYLANGPDTGISRLGAATIGVGDGTEGDLSGTLEAAWLVAGTKATSPHYYTASNCASSASPAVCGSATSGSVAVPTGTNSTLVIDTTAVTANSQIQLTFDASLGTRLGITCNTTVTTYWIQAKTAGTSFTIGASALATNPGCFDYTIIN